MPVKLYLVVKYKCPDAIAVYGKNAALIFAFVGNGMQFNFIASPANVVFIMFLLTQCNKGTMKKQGKDQNTHG